MTKKHDIIWLDEVDSTNNEAARRISDIDNLSVLSAVRQTGGRGQRGNIWLGGEGENLTFSIVLKFSDEAGDQMPIAAYDQFAVSEAAALSVVDFLAEHDVEAKIKWPNDIYAGDRKICGILIENSVTGTDLTRSIIGIGLNINQCNFDVSLPNPTSMLLETGAGSPFDLKDCLENFMEIFSGYVRRYLNVTGGLARLRRMYLSQMWRKDEKSAYQDNRTGKRFEGKICGLSDVGHLLVMTEEGGLMEFAFKEISYLI